MAETAENSQGLSFAQIGWNILSFMGKSLLLVLLINKFESVVADDDTHTHSELVNQNLSGIYIPPYVEQEFAALKAKEQTASPRPKDWANHEILFRRDQYVSRDADTKVNDDVMNYLQQGYYLIHPSRAIITLQDVSKNSNEKVYRNSPAIITDGDFAYHNPTQGRVCLSYNSQETYGLKVHNLTLTKDGLQLKQIGEYTTLGKQNFYKGHIEKIYLGERPTWGIPKIKLLDPKTFAIVELDAFKSSPKKQSNKQGFFKEEDRNSLLGQRKQKNPRLSGLLEDVHQTSNGIIADKKIEKLDKQTLLNFLEVMSQEITDTKITNDSKKNSNELSKVLEGLESKFMNYTGLGRIPAKIRELREIIQDKIEEFRNVGNAKASKKTKSM